MSLNSERPRMPPRLAGIFISLPLLYFAFSYLLPTGSPAGVQPLVAPPVSASPLVQTSPSSARKDVVRITVLRWGFDKTEVARSGGSFRMVITNRSGLKEGLLRLTRDTGEVISEFRFRPNKFEWRENLQLAPGTYFLSEETHPDWSCRISVTE